MSSINFHDRTTPPPSSQELPLPDDSYRTQTPPPQATSSRREKRKPSVTPRKFKRFFTPRSLESTGISSPRHALHETNGIANRRSIHQRSPVRHPRPLFGQENVRTPSTRDSKRRKIYHTPDSSPVPPHVANMQLPAVMEDVRSGEEDQNMPSSPCERVHQDFTGIPGEPFLPEQILEKPVKPIVKMEQRGLSAHLLQMRINDTETSRPKHLSFPVNDWRDETASFYSKPDDIHVAMSFDAQNERIIPFCATSCNDSSLVAVGDEEGFVRLLDSDMQSRTSFANTFLNFRVHRNAIIDMAFSHDDLILATASGDQTARMVDMNTQTTFTVLAHHSASLKQVRFMPGSRDILATSSRDGTVKIWDLRCKGADRPRHKFHVHVPNGPSTTRSSTRPPTWGRPTRAVMDAHLPLSQYLKEPASNSNHSVSGAESARGGTMSVTAISFLPEGREHLLLTASECDASVKLWDIRSISNKRKGQISLAQTKQPESHNQFRSFGISSINVNPSGSRLYTVCKDNTVYAYSTAHLALGITPELSRHDSKHQFAPRETKEGLGPLYGFRHPRLHATSFYVKSAIRKAKDGKSEMLAVGSSDGCAILFPTDERYLPSPESSAYSPTHQDIASMPMVESSRKATVGGSSNSKARDNLVRSTNGSALIRGHDREVGNLCWTSNGDLITVGDDSFVRRWRENRDDARDLRVNGESGGRRHGCGWADIEADYDEDAGEE